MFAQSTLVVVLGLWTLLGVSRESVISDNKWVGVFQFLLFHLPFWILLWICGAFDLLVVS